MIVRDAGDEFEKIPTGPQKAILVNIIDIGHQVGYGGKIQPKCVFLFELAARKKDGTRFLLTKEYTASLAERANLRIDLESWRSRAFTPDQLNGFELDTCIGVCCLLNLMEKKKENGKCFVEISAIARNTSEPIVAETEKTFVPEWIQKKLEQKISVKPKEPQNQQAGLNMEFVDDIPF